MQRPAPEMTPAQVARVRESWRRVLPMADQVAERFFGKLFELEPALRLLCAGDLRERGKELMATINSAIYSLDDTEGLGHAVAELARQHSACAIQDRDYGTAGVALLHTLEHFLGEDFTPELEDAWALTYARLAVALARMGSRAA